MARKRTLPSSKYSPNAKVKLRDSNIDSHSQGICNAGLGAMFTVDLRITRDSVAGAEKQSWFAKVRKLAKFLQSLGGDKWFRRIV